MGVVFWCCGEEEADCDGAGGDKGAVSACSSSSLCADVGVEDCACAFADNSTGVGVGDLVRACAGLNGVMEAETRGRRANGPSSVLADILSARACSSGEW